MQKKKLLISLSLLCFATILLATNTMELMTTLYGENIGDQFGASIVAIDFNGDGYDDLVVKAHGWDPPDAEPYSQYLPYGKIYYFMGGEDFNSEPDYEFEGQYPRHLGNAFGNEDMAMINAGDMNGDGIDDLIVPEKQGMGFSSSISLSVYFGKDIPTATPDIELIYPYLPDYISGVDVFPMGDINGDGLADVSIRVESGAGDNDVYIWTDVFGEPVLCESLPIMWLTGVGDVNMDGYSDMVKYHFVRIDETSNRDHYLTFYYGDENITMSDSLLIGYSNRPVDRYPCALGDINGDGYPDFFAFTDKVWFGGESISVTPNVIMDHQPWIAFDRGMRPSVINGDVNGDGYQDVIGFDHEAGYYSGYLYIWMGSPAMNGSLDFVSLGITNYDNMNYGWSKATGDFKANGYCDIAVGAPWFATQSSGHFATGRVYIMAGNADLHETTVANSDETAPFSNVEKWHTDIYPNPVTIQEPEFSILFKGSGYKATGNYHLEMYNIKGQKLLSQAIHMEDIKDGGLSLESGKLPKGVLIISISKDGIPVSTRKLTNY